MLYRRSVTLWGAGIMFISGGVLHDRTGAWQANISPRIDS